jgi:hypothetical protein
MASVPSATIQQVAPGILISCSLSDDEKRRPERRVGIQRLDLSIM